MAETEAERLQKFMDQLNLTQVQIANDTGYSQASISRYVNGREIDMRFLLKLREKYKANPLWFPTGEGDMLIKDPNEILAQLDESRRIIQQARQREGMLQAIELLITSSDEQWKKIREVIRIMLGK
ncbi:helix-turn-helix domain-containing protein [Leptospira licerasiae]|uniref:helix-turn-helix domain-containing protein n=1 Tax=Leptospira licerasiae TaxID=447106 RepID=UPI0010847294|nr:helix-turn-helix transcriptional regulator [Leptospira licerasiae]TGM88510.1 XRE family transcriptional regulator [Leptospira licerasiae]